MEGLDQRPVQPFAPIAHFTSTSRSGDQAALKRRIKDICETRVRYGMVRSEGRRAERPRRFAESTEPAQAIAAQPQPCLCELRYCLLARTAEVSFDAVNGDLLPRRAQGSAPRSAGANSRKALGRDEWSTASVHPTVDAPMWQDPTTICMLPVLGQWSRPTFDH